MSKRSKILTWGLPIVGVGSLVAGGLTVAADRPYRPAEEPPREPSTTPAAAGLSDAASFIGAIGITEPPGEPIQIGAHVAGIIDEVLVRVDDAVRAGDPLFRVDTRTAQRSVEVRASALGVVRAEAAALRGQIPTARAEVASARASVGSAESAVAAVESDLGDKQNQLRIAEAVNDPRAISTEEIDSRRFAVRLAEARVAEARASVAEAEAAVAASLARLSLLVDDETGADGPDIEAAEQRVEQARSDLEEARTDLDLLTVQAPFDGTILQVNARAGEFAPAKELTDGLIVMGRTGPMHVRVQIDEVDIPRFRRDAPAWASPRGDAALRMPAGVAYVEPLVVPKRRLSGRTSELVDTRVLEVVYAIDPGDAPVYYGQQMDVYIEARPLDSAKAASEDAPTGARP